METLTILKEQFDSNIAYQIMSYVGPHPLAGMMQECNKFMELNIFSKRYNWGKWNYIYGYTRRHGAMEKYFMTYVSFTFEGGAMKISDKWYIWGRKQLENVISYKEIPSNMRLIIRKPQIWVEEVKLVMPPYIHDSGEFYLDPYADDSDDD